MAEVLIPDVDDAVLERIKSHAKDHNRTLEAELQYILISASRQISMKEGRELAAKIRKKLEGRPHSDSAELIREDRDR